MSGLFECQGGVGMSPTLVRRLGRNSGSKFFTIQVPFIHPAVPRTLDVLKSLPTRVH